MTSTTTKTTNITKLRQVNLYVEMSYEVPENFVMPDWYDEDGETTKEWVYRLENDLPDHNLHFLTTCENIEDMLEEGSKNCPEIKDFLEDYKENIADICWEDDFDPNDAMDNGCPECSDMTDSEITDNWCGND